MSRRYLCINCWRRLPAEELLYRPADEAAAGPDWMRWQQDEELRPVSERARPGGLAAVFSDGHAATEGLQLYCVCTEPLTSRAALAGDEEMGVGFAGPRSSGKTLLTTTSVKVLDGCRVGEAEVGLLGIGSTNRRFGALTERLFRDGRRPDPTRPESQGAAPAESTNFCWEIHAGHTGDRAGLLAIFDLAGETWGLPSHERRERFDRYLDMVTSLVFLIDGAAVAADLGLDARDAWVNEPPGGHAVEAEWLAAIVDRLGDRAAEVDLAITLSKGDLLWGHEMWAALAPPPGEDCAAGEERAVRQAMIVDVLGRSGRSGLVRAARGHFRQVGLFAVSSLGFRPGAEDVGEDGRLLREVEPRGVTEPLLWLLGLRLRELAASP